MADTKLSEWIVNNYKGFLLQEVYAALEKKGTAYFELLSINDQIETLNTLYATVKAEQSPNKPPIFELNFVLGDVFFEELLTKEKPLYDLICELLDHDKTYKNALEDEIAQYIQNKIRELPHRQSFYNHAGFITYATKALDDRAKFAITVAISAKPDKNSLINDTADLSKAVLSMAIQCVNGALADSMLLINTTKTKPAPTPSKPADEAKPDDNNQSDGTQHHDETLSPGLSAVKILVGERLKNLRWPSSDIKNATDLLIESDMVTLFNNILNGEHTTNANPKTQQSQNPSAFFPSESNSAACLIDKETLTKIFEKGEECYHFSIEQLAQLVSYTFNATRELQDERIKRDREGESSERTYNFT